MSRGLKQGILALVLLGALGFVYFKNRWGRNTESEPVNTQEALSRYGFYLTESAKKCGIDFRHEAPTLDPKLAHIEPLLAAMNASVSAIDFDGDGKIDLYVVTSKEGGKNR